MEFTTKRKNNNLILMQGRKIKGFVFKTQAEGYAYSIGKPSDPAFFAHVGTTPWGESEAMVRLKIAIDDIQNILGNLSPGELNLIQS